MPHTPAFSLNINDSLHFISDSTIPFALTNKHTITNIHTLVINDFYFNNQLLPCYELRDLSANKLYITPFKFNEEEELKLRVSKPLTQTQIANLFDAKNYVEVLNELLSKADDKDYISINPTLPPELTNWLGKAYYIDLKESNLAEAIYIEYDTKNKKNLNPQTLMTKHAFQRYSLLQGDYAVYYLEINLSRPEPVFATIFLNASDIEHIERAI